MTYCSKAAQLSQGIGRKPIPVPESADLCTSQRRSVLSSSRRSGQESPAWATQVRLDPSSARPICKHEVTGSIPVGSTI
jgi:hypothetical protein